MRWGTTALAACALLGVAAPALGDEPPAAPASADDAAPASTWEARYRAARKLLTEGRFRAAAESFRALANDSASAEQRERATDLAELAEHWASRVEDAEPLFRTQKPTRTRDEITLLYASSLLYGIGTGAWYLLQVQPDSALTATLPFIGISAAPVIGVAIVDGFKPLPFGVPHGISSGLYLGLGEGIFASAYQHARAHRVDAASADNTRWQPETVASVLWGASTLGGIAGGALAAGLPTTQGRISYTASTTLWGGLLGVGFTGALVPANAHRTETTVLVGGLAYNAGLLGGMLTAARVSPSVARVRIGDLSALAGGLASGGIYLAFAGRDANTHAAFGFTAAGATLGLAAGWWLTRNMKGEYPEPTQPAVVVQPSILPVNGGAAIGVQGSM